MARMEKMIYLDHNSTTPYSPSVRQYLEHGILKDWHNASSMYPVAHILGQKIKEHRSFIADYLNCSSKHLFFTSGGTESINTILSSKTLKLNKINAVITSPLEHTATIKAAEYLLNHEGIKVRDVLHNEHGEILLNELEERCSKNPGSLLSFLSSNNETGVITDVKEISKIARKYGCLVHIDAVQSLGKTAIDLEDWDVDFVSFSGHKIGAMKGIGLLYARKPFAPLMFGGNQERGLRPGTHNYPAIRSFHMAIQDIDLDKQEYVRDLRNYFEEKLLKSNLDLQKKTLNLPFRKFKVNCTDASNRLSNTSNVYCGGISNYTVALGLAQKGVCVSTGSACHAGSPDPSHVMTHVAHSLNEESPREYANSCIRVSLSSSNTKQEIDVLVELLIEIYSKSYTEADIPVANFVPSKNL